MNISRRGFFVCCIFAISFAMTTPSPAVGGDTPSATQIDALFTAITSPSEPGMAVLIRRDRRTVFKRAYGSRDLRSGLPIQTDTNFRLASMTKQFTAMAVLLLIHDGKLHYEDVLTRVLPGFPAYGHAITIRMLLNHTSGIRAYEDVLKREYPNRADREIPQVTDADVLAWMKQETSTKFPAGTQWDYSNTGYVLLGAIVEKVSGMPFGNFLEQRIFRPLKMNNTVVYEYGKNRVRKRAYGYARVGTRWMEADQNPTSATLGDGGIYSSVDDLEKWDEALSRNSLLSADEFQPAVTPVLLPGGQLPLGPDGHPLAYGFGWLLDPYRAHRTMSHRGGSTGFRTDIERFPDDKLTIIILCNRTDIQPRDLAHKVADIYFELHR
jgi:CubicO group peptidase (beta-lactamase class C family)